MPLMADSFLISLIFEESFPAREVAGWFPTPRDPESLTVKEVQELLESVGVRDLVWEWNFEPTIEVIGD